MNVDAPMCYGRDMHTDRFVAARQRFRRLHEAGCFVMPNPWDVGSARYLQHLGFPALATTSAGFAFSQGWPDSDLIVTRSAVLAHLAEIAAATDVPVNADFASGYGIDPEAVADSVGQCVATGVAGLSVEDRTDDDAQPLYDLALAVERIAAARAAIDACGGGVLLTARAECFLVSHPDPLRESVRRLQAYAAAGADVLYAPGVSAADDIRTLVASIAPNPFNLLVGRNAPFTVADVAAMGVRRISIGGALSRAAWTGFMHAAQELAAGRFDGMAALVPYADINTFLANDVEARRTTR